jgi:hypothetical protein
MKIDPLDRLFQSAAQAPEPATSPLPLGWETRVLAEVRQQRAQGDVWRIIPLLRAGLACAGACAVLTAALAFNAARDDAESEAFMPTNPEVYLALR